MEPPPKKPCSLHTGVIPVGGGTGGIAMDMKTGMITWELPANAGKHAHKVSLATLELFFFWFLGLSTEIF